MTHFINGQWLAGGAEGFSKRNPVSGETLWQGKAAAPDQRAPRFPPGHVCLLPNDRP